MLSIVPDRFVSLIFPAGSETNATLSFAADTSTPDSNPVIRFSSLNVAYDNRKVYTKHLNHRDRCH